jgi:hypothetical protein
MRMYVGNQKPNRQLSRQFRELIVSPTGPIPYLKPPHRPGAASTPPAATHPSGSSYGHRARRFQVSIGMSSRCHAQAAGSGAQLRNWYTAVSSAADRMHARGLSFLFPLLRALRVCMCGPVCRCAGGSSPGEPHTAPMLWLLRMARQKLLGLGACEPPALHMHGRSIAKLHQA